MKITILNGNPAKTSLDIHLDIIKKILNLGDIRSHN